jgi:hypothetical protein
LFVAQALLPWTDGEDARDEPGGRVLDREGGIMLEGKANSLAKGLGWFSVALGVAELVAPRKLARAVGLKGREGVVAAYGARELATGIAILASRDPAPWIWARVVGDAADIGTLAAGDGLRPDQRLKTIMALAAVAGVTALDVLCGRWLRRDDEARVRPILAEA